MANHNLLLPRSRCYSLSPIYIADRGPECLTSYVNRLAWAHCITAVDLVRESFPHVIDTKIYQQIGFDKPLGAGHTINGLGRVAMD